MVKEQQDTTVRVFWAFRERSVGTTMGPFRDDLHKRKDEGILDLAAVEDRALQRSNLSATEVR